MINLLKNLAIMGGLLLVVVNDRAVPLTQRDAEVIRAEPTRVPLRRAMGYHEWMRAICRRDLCAVLAPLRSKRYWRTQIARVPQKSWDGLPRAVMIVRGHVFFSCWRAPRSPRTCGWRSRALQSISVRENPGRQAPMSQREQLEAEFLR